MGGRATRSAKLNPTDGPPAPDSPQTRPDNHRPVSGPATSVSPPSAATSGGKSTQEFSDGALAGSGQITAPGESPATVATPPGRAKGQTSLLRAPQCGEPDRMGLADARSPHTTCRRSHTDWQDFWRLATIVHPASFCTLPAPPSPLQPDHP